MTAQEYLKVLDEEGEEAALQRLENPEPARRQDDWVADINVGPSIEPMVPSEPAEEEVAEIPLPPQGSNLAEYLIDRGFVASANPEGARLAKPEPPDPGILGTFAGGFRTATDQVKIGFYGTQALMEEDPVNREDFMNQVNRIKAKQTEEGYTPPMMDFTNIGSRKGYLADSVDWGVGTAGTLVPIVGSIMAGGLASGKVGGLAGSVFGPKGSAAGTVGGSVVGSFSVGWGLYAGGLYSDLMDMGVSQPVAKKTALDYGAAASMVSIVPPAAAASSILGALGKNYVRGRVKNMAIGASIGAPSESLAEGLAESFVIMGEEFATGRILDADERNKRITNAVAAGGLMGVGTGGSGGFFQPRVTVDQTINNFIDQMDTVERNSAIDDLRLDLINTLSSRENLSTEESQVLKYLRQKSEDPATKNIAVDRGLKEVQQLAIAARNRSRDENRARIEELLDRGDARTTKEDSELAVISFNDPILLQERNQAVGQLSQERAATPPTETAAESSPLTPLTAQALTARRSRVERFGEGWSEPVEIDGIQLVQREGDTWAILNPPETLAPDTPRIETPRGKFLEIADDVVADDYANLVEAARAEMSRRDGKLTAKAASKVEPEVVSTDNVDTSDGDSGLVQGELDLTARNEKQAARAEETLKRKPEAATPFVESLQPGDAVSVVTSNDRNKKGKMTPGRFMQRLDNGDAVFELAGGKQIELTPSQFNRVTIPKAIDGDVTKPVAKAIGKRLGRKPSQEKIKQTFGVKEYLPGQMVRSNESDGIGEGKIPVLTKLIKKKDTESDYLVENEGEFTNSPEKTVRQMNAGLPVYLPEGFNTAELNPDIQVSSTTEGAVNRNKVVAVNLWGRTYRQGNDPSDFSVTRGAEGSQGAARGLGVFDSIYRLSPERLRRSAAGMQAARTRESGKKMTTQEMAAGLDRLDPVDRIILEDSAERALNYINRKSSTKGQENTSETRDAARDLATDNIMTSIVKAAASRPSSLTAQSAPVARQILAAFNKIMATPGDRDAKADAAEAGRQISNQLQESGMSEKEATDTVKPIVDRVGALPSPIFMAEDALKSATKTIRRTEANQAAATADLAAGTTGGSEPKPTRPQAKAPSQAEAAKIETMAQRRDRLTEEDIDLIQAQLAGEELSGSDVARAGEIEAYLNGDKTYEEIYTEAQRAGRPELSDPVRGRTPGRQVPGITASRAAGSDGSGEAGATLGLGGVDGGAAGTVPGVPAQQDGGSSLRVSPEAQRARAVAARRLYVQRLLRLTDKEAQGASESLLERVYDTVRSVLSPSAANEGRRAVAFTLSRIGDRLDLTAGELAEGGALERSAMLTNRIRVENTRRLAAEMFRAGAFESTGKVLEHIANDKSLPADMQLRAKSALGLGKRGFNWDNVAIQVGIFRNPDGTRTTWAGLLGKDRDGGKSIAINLDNGHDRGTSYQTFLHEIQHILNDAKWDAYYGLPGGQNLKLNKTELAAIKRIENFWKRAVKAAAAEQEIAFPDAPTDADYARIGEELYALSDPNLEAGADRRMAALRNPRELSVEITSSPEVAELLAELGFGKADKDGKVAVKGVIKEAWDALVQLEAGTVADAGSPLARAFKDAMAINFADTGNAKVDARYTVPDSAPSALTQELAEMRTVSDFIEAELERRGLPGTSEQRAAILEEYEVTRREPTDSELDTVGDPETMSRAVEGDVIEDVITTSRATAEEAATLEQGLKLRLYRAMQVIDGNLYPPMSAMVEGRLRNPTEIGVWEVAEERPDLLNKDGKFILRKGNGAVVPAAYNPYFHASSSPLNDQFTSANTRPNLVTVEVEVPASELASGYRAKGAKNAVGEVTWNSGVVSSKLPADRKRKVVLSRYSKVVRVVPDSEVAATIANLLEGTNLSIPENTVTPSLKVELERNGVEVRPTRQATESRALNENQTSLSNQGETNETQSRATSNNSPNLVYQDSEGELRGRPRAATDRRYLRGTLLRLEQSSDDGRNLGAGETVRFRADPRGQTDLELERQRRSQGAEAFRRFIKILEEDGAVLDTETFENTVIEGRAKVGDGSEHQVQLDKPTNRVIKYTNPDVTGSGAVGQSLNVFDYLTNLEAQNEIFGDDIRLEGIVNLGDPYPRVVISQPFIKGRNSTQPEIDAYLGERGFEKQEDGSWSRVRDGKIQRVSDAVPSNLKTVRVGRKLTVVPFDVQVSIQPVASVESRAMPDVERNKLVTPEATVSGPALYSIAAWHGTPNIVPLEEGFRTRYIGTGEGAQVYGYGLYFAERETVGASYQVKLTKDKLKDEWQRWAREKPKLAADFAEQVSNRTNMLSLDAGDYGVELQNVLGGFVDYGVPVTGAQKIEGNLYKVELDTDPVDLLAWDELISQQSDKIQKILRKVGIRPGPMVIGSVAYGRLVNRATNSNNKSMPAYEDLAQEFGVDLDGERVGELNDADLARIETDFREVWDQLKPSEKLSVLEFTRGDAFAAASLVLNELGLPGIRYLDGQSRNRPYNEVRRAFLKELPEDALDADVQEAINSGVFNADQVNFLNALKADDWFGFDFPSQAISASLAEGIENWNPSQTLRDSIKPLLVDATSNYVIFDENLIKITERNGQPVSLEQAAREQATESRASYQGITYDPRQLAAQARAEGFELVYHGDRNQPLNEDYSTWTQANIPLWTAFDRANADWFGEARPLFVRTSKVASYDNMIAAARAAGIEGEYGDPAEPARIPEVSKHSPYEGTNENDLLYIPKVREELNRQGFDAVRLFDQLERDEVEVLVVIGSPTQVVDPLARPDIRESRAVGPIESAKELIDQSGREAIKDEETFFNQVWPKLLKRTGRQLIVSPRNFREAARRAISDLEGFLRENPKFADYYNKDWELTRTILGDHLGRPITNDEFLMFRILAGLNSPNTMLPSNMGDAVNFFDLWVNTGNFDAIRLGPKPTTGTIVVLGSPFEISGTTQNIKARSIKAVEELVKRFGTVQEAVDFLQEPVTVQQLHSFNREMGYKGDVSKIGNIRSLVQQATGQDKLIPRMFIFGQKVGAYTLNALGDSRYTTVDVWESRFIRSYFKGMFEQNTGLPVDNSEHDVFTRFNEVFKEEFEKSTGLKWEASALQAVRWFYIIDSAKKAGYSKASTNETISFYTERKLRGSYGYTGPGGIDPQGGAAGDGTGRAGTEGRPDTAAQRDTRVESRAVSPQQDTDYLAAVERGDMETAQRMVDEVARAAGYNWKGVRFGFYVNGIPLPPARSAELNYGTGYYVAEGATLENTTSKSVSVSPTANPNDLRRLGLKPEDVEFRRDVVFVKAEKPLRSWPVRNYDKETADFINAQLAYDSAVQEARRAIRADFETTSWGKTVSDLIASGRLPFDSVQGMSGRKGMSSELVVQNASQIKSADPVTRDNQGNVIPLSQRFNEASADIRESRAVRDPEGEGLAIREVNGGQEVSLFGVTVKDPQQTLTPEGLIDISDAKIDSTMKSLIKIIGAVESVPDKLRRGSGLDYIAKQIEEVFDLEQKRLGVANGFLFQAEKKIGLRSSTRKEAQKTFEDYIRARESGDKAQAQKIYETATEAQRAYVDAWNQYSQETGKINLQIKTPEGKPMQVYDSGAKKWRPIRTVQNFFPRSFRPEVQAVLRNPALDPALHTDLLDSLVAEKRAKNREDAKQMIDREYFGTETGQDYFAGVERGRRDPMPEIFYDYSFNAALRYMQKWAQRTAQIEALGQKTTEGTGDWFETNITKVRDDKTRVYLGQARDRIYNRKNNDVFSVVMNWLNVAATGAQLGNPATAFLNLFGGTFLNFSMYGTDTFRAMKNLLLSKDGYTSAMQFGAETGTTGKDMLRILNDADMDAGKYFDANSTVSQGLSKFATFTMKWGGYTSTENFIRATATLAARNKLMRAIKANNTNPSASSVSWLKNFAKRENLDFEAMIRENGAGAESGRFIRRAVNIPQGSYRIDMTPIYTDSDVGRFLFKYQKFGTQLSRMFWRHHLQPLLTKPNVENLGNLVRFIGGAIGFGTLIAGGRAALFGYPDPGPDEEDIRKALLENKDLSRTWALIGSRAVASINAAGAFGFYGNYAQFALDWRDQQRTKNPLAPPGIASIDAFVELFSRLREQGKLTLRDFDEIGQNTLAIYRANRRLGLSALDAVGVEFNAVQDWSSERQIRQTRKYARAYADEMQIENRQRTPDGRVAKTPMSPLNREITLALRRGDAGLAKVLLNDALKGASTKEERDAMKASIQSSIRFRQPLALAGRPPSAEERRDFFRWAQKNIPGYRVESIKQLDEMYRKGAGQLGINIR